jgi:hypothetical protein
MTQLKHTLVLSQPLEQVVGRGANAKHVKGTVQQGLQAHPVTIRSVRCNSCLMV